MDTRQVLVVLRGQEHPVGVSKRMSRDIADIAGTPGCEEFIFFYLEDDDA